MILHTVNKSALSHNCLQQCLAASSPEDAILLLEDGVYSATCLDQLAFEYEPALYALEQDLNSRGLQHRIDSRVKIVSDLDFVRLTTEYDKVVSWY